MIDPRGLKELEIGALARMYALQAEPAAAPAVATAARAAITVRPAGDVAALDWEALREAVRTCVACGLCKQRKQAVFGVGAEKADWLFIGEGPGADEDEQGEPFVGQAGKLLDSMLAAVGIRRGREVYIANVVKCRPPGNRDPEPDEVATCSPFLFRQIEAIGPRAIVALGSPATKTLLGTKTGITALRGKWGAFRGIPVLPTFHPAYLLRAYTVENRKAVFDDLKAAKARIDEAP